MRPELLDQIRIDQPIGKVTADGAYDTRGCHAAIAARGARRRHTRPPERAAMAKDHAWCSGQEQPTAPHVALAARSGGNGAAITDEAWSRQRGDASSSSVNA